MKFYYFSGTGNSYAVCKKLSESFNCEMTAIKDLENHSTVIESKRVGLVFPIYYQDMPNIVHQFISNSNWTQADYIFTIPTFGGGPGTSFKSIDELLRSKGKNLSFSFGIHMPQNAFYKRFENIEVLLEKMNESIIVIHHSILAKASGYASNSRLQFYLEKPLIPLFKKIYKRYFEKETGIKENRIEQIYHLDALTQANDLCNGCGMCLNICPVQNIQMIETNPQWLHHCENCLACYNACPQKAISVGFIKKDYHYVHPQYDEFMYD